MRSLLTLAFLFFAVHISLGQTIPSQEYVITRFGMENGLPQSSVNDILQTRDGYIWLATFGGLVKFDGNTFTTFDRSNTENFNSDRILRLFEDSEGGIWIFPENVETIMYRFIDGNIRRYTFSQKESTLLDLYTDGRGVLWLTAFGKSYQFKNDEFVEIPVSNDQDLLEPALSDTNGAWMLGGSKILKTYGDQVVQYMDVRTKKDVIPNRIIEYPKGSGDIYLGTIDEGVIRVRNRELDFFKAGDGLPSNYVLDFITDRSGNFYTYMFSKFAKWNGTSFEEFDPVREPEDVQYKAILEDNEGNLWMGTAGNGLFRLRPSAITMIDKDQGLDMEIMLSITMLRDGSALFSTNCGGIYEWRNGRARYSNLHKFMDGGCNWSVYQDSKDRIWIGAEYPYVINSFDEEGVYPGKGSGYIPGVIFTITEDKDHKIWIGTSTGLYIFEDDKIIKHYTTANGLSYTDVRTLFEDSNGTMWVGTMSGLNAIRDNEVTKISLANDYEGEEEYVQPTVRAIYKDEDGVMWIGSYGNGLFRIKDGEIANLTVSDGLFDNIISHIVEDEYGYFWMGSNRGITRVKRSDLNSYLSREISDFKVSSYGASDGMNSAETNGGFQPNAVKDSEGRIYFPTVEGVAVVNPDKVKINEIPPPVQIEHLRTIDEELPFEGSIELPYDNPFIEIGYTAISFTDPRNVNFKYKMEGLDDSWIDVGTRRVALYSKLPAGKYTFRVIASNNDGVWNEVGASMDVIIIPPYWQTMWFYSIIGFILLAVAPLIFYYRVNQLKKENDRQKKFTEQLIQSQEQERRRIAAELHDGLGQQILVIKNRVELAQKQVENAGLLREQLDEILQSAVVSISDVRSISHGLRPVHLEKFGLTDSLNNMCEQLQESSGIEWSFYFDDIDGYISEDKEINFYRVIQESINNILKHSSADEASVVVKKIGKEIRGSIWDNGVGFDMKKEGDFQGLGFIGMRERIESLGGSISINSEAGSGTSIKIIVPFSQTGTLA